MRRLRVASLALLAALFLSSTLGVASGSPQVKRMEGLFGTILELSQAPTRPVSAVRSITLETRDGAVEITATSFTVVRIPGWETGSVDNLLVGDPVAVLLLSADGGTAIALTILVRGTQPVRTRHFTGIVISIDEDEETLSLRSKTGETITAPILGTVPSLQPGELVTAVLEQDLPTGSLVITGLEPAISSLERITLALDLARSSGTAPDVKALQQRLRANSVRHLTALQEASQRLAPNLRPKIQESLGRVQDAYGQAFARAMAGKPKVEVVGIVADIDRGQKTIIVESVGLGPVEIGITSETSLWRAPAGLPPSAAEPWLQGGADTRAYAREFGGREMRFEQLDLASRVRIRYQLDSGAASRILVLPGAILQPRQAEALLSLSANGRAMGRVIAIDQSVSPPAVNIQDRINETMLRLTVSPDSAILENSTPLGIASLPGALVAASFDPASLAIIELNILESNQNRGYIHGVVHSFIPKVLPGNLSVFTSDGKVRAFNHTADTVIHRDGIRVTIGQVRIGDLVQPSTQYSSGSQDLALLNLSSPRPAPIRGTIRGIETRAGRETLVTISNNWSELTSVVVKGDTDITSKGAPIDVSGLALGQRILSGAYDPLSGLADRLVIGPPRAIRIRGEITAVDEANSSVTITPRRGRAVELFVRESTPVRIIMRGNPEPRISDLRQGQQVRIGFYDADSHEVLKLDIR